MDLFSDDFSSEGIVLLENNGSENRGIPIRSDHYVLIFCLKGQSFKRINHHRFQVTPFSVHIVQPGQIHSFSNTTNDYMIYVMLFNKEFLEKFSLPLPKLDELLTIDGDCTPKIQLDENTFKTWLFHLDQINTELIRTEKYQSEVIQSSIINLMYQIKRNLSHQFSFSTAYSRKQEIFNEFRTLIETYFQTKRSVAAYADLMNITSKHLSETVKSVSNRTALQFIQERLVHESEYLLAYSNLSVKNIAYTLYFDSPSHFGRFFKKHKALTPLAFRSINKF